jgi:hypothetical protein
MRRPGAVLRTALAAAAVLALGTACTGGDGGPPAASASSPAAGTATGTATGTTTGTATSDGTSTAPSPSTSAAPAAGTPFCRQAGAVVGELEGAVLGSSAGGSAPEVVQRAAADLDGIAPPPELATDWATFTAGAHRLAATAATLDPSDPTAAGTLERAARRLGPGFSGAAGRLQAHLLTQCGVAPAAGLPAPSLPAPSATATPSG